MRPPSWSVICVIMAKNRKVDQFRVADSSGLPVPSRLQLIDCITENRDPVVFETLCHHFSLTETQQRQALQSRLRRMCHQGVLGIDHKGRYVLSESMEMVTGKVCGHANGYGFVIPDDGGQDVHLDHQQMRRVLHGDRVLAGMREMDYRGRREGVVVEVLIDTERRIVGQYLRRAGMGFVASDDRRFVRDIRIPDALSGGAKSGDTVAVRIARHPVQHGDVEGEVIEVLGPAGAPGMETEIAIRKFDLPDQWPETVIRQLNAMGEQLEIVTPHVGRIDLREVALVTIDGADARDFDDAVYCTRTANGWQLLVAIADVSHYVELDSALDQAACERGNSIYFPDRVIPMLPTVLSNGICSLSPHEDRYCLVCDMQMNPVGEITEFQFYPAIMHSHARLTYDTVNAIVSQKKPRQRQKWRSVVPQLDNLYALFLCLDEKRKQRGAIDFEFPESLIELDAQQRIKTLSLRTRNDAHRLIEECMLAANVCAAQFLKEHLNENTIFRSHDGPKTDSLDDARRALNGFGYTLEGGEAPSTMDYSRLVSEVADHKKLSSVVQSLLLRTLGQAVYSTKQTGHFALAYPIYTHFTSPIRRYSDLVVHRAIRAILTKCDTPRFTSSGYTMTQVAEHCSATERRAEEATREVIAKLKAQYMQNKTGEAFSGVISGVKEFGLFVLLDGYGVDGLVYIASLTDDYYHFDPVRCQLEGERTAVRFRLGDAVTVRLERVELTDGKISFSLLSHEKMVISPNRITGKRKRRMVKAKNGHPKGKRHRYR